MTLSLEQAVLFLNSNTIEVIDLNDTGLNDVDILRLCEVLRVNQTLVELKLEENNFGVKGALALATVLESHPAMRELYLNGNSITEVGVEALLSMYAHHSALVKVCMAEGTGANKNQRQRLRELNNGRQVIKQAAQANDPTQEDSHFDQILETFRDVLTAEQTIMVDPVVASQDGCTYERESINNWLGYELVSASYPTTMELMNALEKPLGCRQWQLLFDMEQQRFYGRAKDIGGFLHIGWIDDSTFWQPLLDEGVLNLSTFSNLKKLHSQEILRMLNKHNRKMQKKLYKEKNIIFTRPVVYRFTA